MGVSEGTTLPHLRPLLLKFSSIKFFRMKPSKHKAFILVRLKIDSKRGINLEYLEGILKIANLVLASIAGFIAISLIKKSEKRKELNAWVWLIVALVFFAIQEILGALRAFQIFESSYLTHIVPTIILVLLVIALLKQIYIQKGK